MSTPLIGLTAYQEQARFGVWDQRADMLPTEYAGSIAAAGGVPLLLPVQDPALAPAALARLDGLVVTGGPDVDPGRYGADPHPTVTDWRVERDAWELALLDAAAERRMPVLGICRGMQIMAVHAGGALEQHVPDIVEHHQHSPGGDTFGDIGVSTDEGTRLRSLIGDRGDVGCHHHQSVASHPGLRAVAYADDGILEAIEADGDRFVVGVQWHPETRADAGLFRGLVRAATAWSSAMTTPA